MLDNIKSFVKNKTVSILGLGISNLPLLKILCDAECEITIRDTNEIKGEALDIIEKYSIKTITGENYLEDINDDIVFRSPGIMFSLPQIQKAIKNGSYITSEMELFFELCPAKIIGITGSDGKTTTTTVISEILKADGKKVFLGGNIGTPLLPLLDEIKEDDFCVVELSSFQLMSMKKSPYISVITNITPNHLDKHKDYQEYIDSKKNIMLFQDSNCLFVTNASNDITKEIAKETKGALRTFSLKDNTDISIKNGTICYKDEEILKVSDIKLPGLYNVENFMAAIGALYGTVKNESIVKTAKSFGGVAHRVEFIRELDGVKYYNSSIDSSPNRTKNTLSVFENKVVMISGGKDKGIPYDEIGPEILKHVRVLILIGATAKVIEEAVKKVDKDNSVEIFHATTYPEAVNLAKENAKTGDSVVLSPASTSFDMFKNFEERGNLFKELVNNL